MIDVITKNMEIVKAERADTSHIIDLLKSTATWLKESHIKQWGFLLEGGEDEEIERAITNDETYKVLIEGKLVGTLTLSEKQNEWDLYIWGEDHSSDSIYLHRLAITPSYMKKGIGNRIITWIEDRFVSEKDFIKLDCVSQNSKLNRFYQNNGFNFIGLSHGHHKYQKKINDEIQMDNKS